MSNQIRPRVGVSVIIIKDNKVLLGKRIGSHGQGTWAFPGGHIELFNNLIDTCIKEVKEETDLDINIIDANPVAVTNDFFTKNNKHYITLFFRAKIINEKEPKLTEPDKCEGWYWFSWNELPSPLFIPIQNLLKQNFKPF
ncbi:MAG: NUDIX domain-containing protein [Nanoarchaeota archaeon]|nr:NUDIX domain-containing protein [Nanoarchaeota archaeon]MBU1027521.1 NUDIX domain-containing protein [Nanoarchaeota archaeon]